MIRIKTQNLTVLSSRAVFRAQSEVYSGAFLQKKLTWTALPVKKKETS